MSSVRESVAKDGSIIQLVDEADRAWHAGVAFSAVLHELHPKGTKLKSEGTTDEWNDVNSHSIGISMEGNGTVEGFTEQQYSILVHLLQHLMSHTAIEPRGVVSLADVARPVGRHVAPGGLFDWHRVRSALEDSA